jgi:hypothetical protein
MFKIVVKLLANLLSASEVKKNSSLFEFRMTKGLVGLVRAQNMLCV